MAAAAIIAFSRNLSQTWRVFASPFTAVKWLADDDGACAAEKEGFSPLDSDSMIFFDDDDSLSDSS